MAFFESARINELKTPHCDAFIVHEHLARRFFMVKVGMSATSLFWFLVFGWRSSLTYRLDSIYVWRSSDGEARDVRTASPGAMASASPSEGDGGRRSW